MYRRIISFIIIISMEILTTCTMNALLSGIMDIQVAVIIGMTAREMTPYMDLIKTKRGASGGIYVTQPTLDRVRDSVLHAWNFGGLSPAELTEFRQFTEPGIAELAAMRRTDEDIEALRANLDYCEKAIKDEGRIELSKHLEFHRLLANACHNRLISSFMEAVTKVHEEIFQQLPLNLEVGIEDLEYNKEFIECLVHRDKDRIRKLMRAHFDIFREHFEGITDTHDGQEK